MKVFHQTVRPVAAWAWYLFAFLMVVAAVSVSLARYILPYAEQYKQEIEVEAESLLGVPVSIEQLTAEWRGIWPSLVLQNVAVKSSDSGQELLRLNSARIGINLLSSVVNGEVRLGELTVAGVHLRLERTTAGQMKLTGLDLPESESDEELDTDQLIEMLFGVRQLKFEDIAIEWVDLRNGGERQDYQNIKVSLRNRGDRHQLEGSLRLPDMGGRTLEFAADVVGDPRSGDWEGEIYAKASAINLGYWLQDRVWQGVRVDNGWSNFSIWAGWREGALISIEGDAEIYSLDMQRVEGGRLPIDMLSSGFAWHATESGWDLLAENFSYQFGEKQWPATNLVLEVGALDENRRPHKATAWVDFVDVKEVIDLVGALGVVDADNEWLGRVDRSVQAGLLREVVLEYERGQAGTKYYFDADFSKLTIQADKGIPGVRNLAGRIRANERQGQLSLDGRASYFDYPKLFRYPISMELVQGDLYWQRDQQATQLYLDKLRIENQDLVSSATLNLQLEEGSASPFMDLHFKFANANLEKVSRYLPVGIMSDGLVGWLDAGVEGGTASSGALAFHGSLSDFPFKEKPGKFEVAFDFEQGQLNYTEGWPKIDGIAATAIFTDTGMHFDVAHGDLLGTSITDTEVYIESFFRSPVQLIVDGNVAGAADSQLEFLRISPLREGFGKHFDNIRMTGDSSLALRLGIPLSGKMAVDVDGKIQFAGNGFTLPPFSSLLSHLDGELRFSESGVWAEGLQASMLGGKAVINALTKGKGDQREIRISSKGTVLSAALAEQLPYPLVNSVAGKAKAEVLVQLRQGAQINVKSDLQGMAIALPAPMGKQQKEARSLELVVKHGESDSMLIDFDYLNGANGQLYFESVGGGKQLARGGVLIGKGVATIPETGLLVESKHTKLALNEWTEVWSNDTQPVASEEKGRGWFPAPLKVKADEVDYMGNSLSDAELDIKRGSDAWSFAIKSRQAVGRVELPFRLYQRPLTIDFDHLHLSGFTQQGEQQDKSQSLDPRELPSINVRVGDFRYGDRLLGNVAIELARHSRGLMIDKLELKTKETIVAGSGRWLIDGNDHLSMFKATIESRDTGKMLSDFGFKDTVDDGQAKVALDVKWDSPLYDLDFATLNGEFSLDIEDGRLLEVSPGAGRLFGLFSFQSLSRRLLLDFSDMFQKGFSFDHMHGTFSLREGSAYTDNFYILGPAALIELKGRTGLVAKDYEQLVTVTPYVSENLPILGYLLATPQTAAALLFFQRLFKTQIEKATQVKYKVLGTWQQPEVVNVSGG